MTDFVLLCAVPGAGKTYFAKVAEESGEYKLVSSDDIREALWGDASIQKNLKRVFSEMEARTIANLQEGYNVIYDATNIKRKDRLSILNKVKELCPSVGTYCLRFDVPLDECIRRAAARERKVSADVIYRMAERFEEPQYDEGWDYICTVRPIEEE